MSRNRSKSHHGSKRLHTAGHREVSVPSQSIAESPLALVHSELFLQLPRHLWHEILGTWLTVLDFVRLDSALVNRKFRKEWFTLLQEIGGVSCPGFVAPTRGSHEIANSLWHLRCNKSTPLTEMLTWLNKRKLSLLTVNLFCPIMAISILEEVDKWLPLLPNVCHNLRALTLSNITVIFDPDLIPLVKICCRTLVRCHLSNCGSLSNNTFSEIVNSCHQLTSLTYDNCGEFFNDFPVTDSSLIRIKELDIGESAWDTKCMEHVLKNFKNLESLRLSFVQHHGHDYTPKSTRRCDKPYDHYDWKNVSFLIEQETFRFFKLLKKFSPQLKTLHLNLAKELFKHQLGQLQRVVSFFGPFLKDLECLSVTCDDENSSVILHPLMCPESVGAFSNYQMLNKIVVMHADPRLNYNGSLQKIACGGMLHLQHVRLGPHIAVNTEAFVALSRGCPAIISLEFKDSCVDDTTMRKIPLLFPNLETLDIISTKITFDANLFHIINSKLAQSLTGLGIYCPNLGLTGEVFTRLKNGNHGKILPHLKTLSIRSDSLIGRHFQSLHSLLSRLESVSIVAESLTENDLIDSLRNWQHLKFVEFTSECKISNRLIQALTVHSHPWIGVTLGNAAVISVAAILQFARDNRFSLQKFHLNVPAQFCRSLWPSLVAVLHVLEDENISQKCIDFQGCSAKHDKIWIKRALEYHTYLESLSVGEC